MTPSFRLWAVCAASILVIAGCSSAARTLPAAHTGAQVDAGQLQAMTKLAPSVSPARIPVPPMAQTPPQSATAMNARRPQSDISMLGWTQLPGGATYVAASPDHSLWALSTLGNGTDYYVYHYVNKTWTAIAGAAVRLAVGLDGNPWAVTANGGIYHYNGSSWDAVAGGASDITVAEDGTVYVISSVAGGPYGRGIWRYDTTNKTWKQMPGAGIRIAASWDQTAFSGGIQPGGFYVINTSWNIFYYDPTIAGYHAFNGGAAQVAPTRSGGLFALGYQSGQYGYPIYYNDLNSSTWTQQPGAGTSITTDGVTVYVTGTDGGIYYAPVNAHNIVGNGTPLAGPTYGPNGYGWGPRAVANAFQFPVQSGFDGTGFPVAIVINSVVKASDTATYLSYFGTPSTGRQIYTMPQPGSTSAPTSGLFEATLDVQTVAGLAPGADIYLYVTPDLSFQSISDAYAQVLSDNYAYVVSSSFGGCENSSSAQNGADTIIANGTAAGTAFVAISGDWGNECYYNSTTFNQGVNWPGSNPNVISVGGTETGPGHAITDTGAWNDTFASAGQEATGGGVSTKFTLPAYQSGLAGTASTSYRNVPDIALPAVDDAIYYNGSWARAVGTSWSTPMFAAMLVEIYQYCNAYYYNPQYLPYSVYRSAGYGAFFDVTTGNNQFRGTSPYYSAGSGYDNTTGIGAPLGMPWAQTLCPNRVPAARFRRPYARVLAQRGPAQAVKADVVPPSRGLVDLGARAPSATTRIQIVLRPTATLASDEQTVIGVLRAAGFTIVRTFKNHLVVDAEGPSANVEALFATRLHDVDEGRDGLRYMPVTAAAIPASLAPYVAGLSLDNVVSVKHL